MVKASAGPAVFAVCSRDRWDAVPRMVPEETDFLMCFSDEVVLRDVQDDIGATRTESGVGHMAI